MTFGIWCENKLQERMGDQYKYTLSDILYEHDEKYIRRKNQDTLNAMKAAFGKTKKGQVQKGQVVVIG